MYYYSDIEETYLDFGSILKKIMENNSIKQVIWSQNVLYFDHFFKILTSSTHQICIFPNLLVNTGKNKEEIYQTKDCLENSLGKGFKIVGFYCQFFEWQKNNYFTIQFNLKPPNFEA